MKYFWGERFFRSFAGKERERDGRYSVSLHFPSSPLARSPTRTHTCVLARARIYTRGAGLGVSFFRLARAESSRNYSSVYGSRYRHEMASRREREREEERKRRHHRQSASALRVSSFPLDRSNGRLARSFFSLFPLWALLLTAEQGRKWRIRANGNDKRQRARGRGGRGKRDRRDEER